MRAISISLVFLLSACSGTFYARTAVYTENGLRVGNEAWDDHFNAKLEECKKVAGPKTPEAEECFGDTFNVNKKIGVAIESSVGVLRTFWAAYAAGSDPKKLREVLQQLPAIVNDLPDEFFGGIKKGLK